jgi:hypothetical protein
MESHNMHHSFEDRPSQHRSSQATCNETISSTAKRGGLHHFAIECERCSIESGNQNSTCTRNEHCCERADDKPSTTESPISEISFVDTEKLGYATEQQRLMVSQTKASTLSMLGKRSIDNDVSECSDYVGLYEVSHICQLMQNSNESNATAHSLMGNNPTASFRNYRFSRIV